MKTDFSKKVVVWGMSITSVFITIFTFFYYSAGKEPSADLVGLVSIIITGVIVSYAGKAGLENFQKIKNNSKCESTEKENNL
jgi:hypothetical protein